MKGSKKCTDSTGIKATHNRASRKLLAPFVAGLGASTPLGTCKESFRTSGLA